MRICLWVLGALVAVTGLSADSSDALSNLQFMSGIWRNGTALDGSEELWSAAGGDMMVGAGRVTKQGKTRAFEFMRIESTATGLVFVALPGGKNETRFPAIEVSPQKVVFENREHDFPQRVSYWRESDGQLRARIEGVIAGETKFQEWSWTRWQP
jgi:hypothetical protein